MAPFPHYNSKVLTTLIRQGRALRDRSEQFVRQATATGLWTIRLGLSPFYWLFQEAKPWLRQLAQQQTRVGLGSADRSRRSRSGHSRPDSSRPIRSVLASIQLRPAKQLLPPTTQPEPLVKIASPTIVTRAVQALSRLWRSQTAMASIPTIQGIATALNSRTLVLVTTGQAVLDILTPAQQQQLRDRIAAALVQSQMSRSWQWMPVWPMLQAVVAALKAKTQAVPQQLAAALLPGASASIETAPAEIFSLGAKDTETKRPRPRLGRWLFRGLVGAIASLPFVAIPAIAAEPQPVPTPTARLEPQLAEPQRLKRQMGAMELQGMLTLQTPGQHWIAAQPAPVKTSQSELESAVHQSRSVLTVDAEFIGYEPHLLERLLGWLDTLLVQFESAFAIVWSLVGVLSVVGLHLVQAIRQRLSF